jgi:DNA polymerase-3 subunit epsilon
MYAIFDLETTGGNVQSDGITEIAIIRHDGERELDRFHSLVQPHGRIPYRVVEITGISNAMVAGAPRFFEVAKQVVEFTEGCTLVAHNVRFDYGFLRKEFKSLGYEFKRDVLCTLELSRSLFPGQESYALGRLAESLGLENRPKHRAMEDAAATSELFKMLFQIKNRESELSDPTGNKSRLNPIAAQHKEQLDALPSTPGVYYFFNAWRQLIYIGKSVNIRSRVLSHFNNNSTSRALDMKQAIDHIRYVETGSELVALLKESEEIKRHKPKYNRAQRRARFHFGLFTFRDSFGFQCLRMERIKRNSPNPVALFSSAREARSYLERSIEVHGLCQQKTGLHRLGGSCFHYAIKKCLGACCGEESSESYNKRVDVMLERLQYQQPNFFVIDKGRTEDEVSVVMVQNGKYAGFGYVDSDFQESSPAALKACIQPFMDTKDVRQIIHLYLRQGKPMKVLPF